jgi:prepilin-type N-terminal cleavage/methylation domain-containing protein
MGDECTCALGPIQQMSFVFSFPSNLYRRRLITKNQGLTVRSNFSFHRAICRCATGDRQDSRHFSLNGNASRGFTLPELLVALLVGSILAAIAIPVMNAAMISMRLNSTVIAMSSAISNARYRAIKDSQVYTLTVTTPRNTYVVTNVGTGTADSAVPLPNSGTLLNGGGSATYTFTLCPNGTVYGAGATCPGNNTPPALAATYLGRETDIGVSGAGNVTTTHIH